MTSAFNNLGVTFFAPRDFVGHWCLTNDSTASGVDLTSTGLTDHSPSSYMDILSGFLHNDRRDDRHRSLTFDTDTPKGLRKECYYESRLDNQTHKCETFQYDTGIWLSTIIEEWDLVCDRSWMISMTQSLYMAGFIVSYPMFGYMSDRFGRWLSLLVGAMIEVTGGFGCAFSGSIRTFMMFRFLLGLGTAGRTASSYLVMIEWIGPKWRMHISTLGSIGWVLGYCLIPWISLYFLHFRHMQLFICFYELVFIIWLLRIPESPRWLLTHRKFGNAYKVLLNAAKFNGLIKEGESLKGAEYDPSVKMEYIGKQDTNGDIGARLNYSEASHEFSNKNIMTQAVPRKSENHTTDPSEPYDLDSYNKRFSCLVDTINAKEFTENEDKLTVIDLFRYNNLRKYLLILFYVWASNSFVYYGIVLTVGDFGGDNLFVSFTISGLTEFPSMFFTIICMKYLPRSTSNLIIYILTGSLCALQVPLKYYDYKYLQLSTIMLAKLTNSCAFTFILYQTMELFPTSIRQTAYSSCSLAGRIGSILAPFVKELAQVTNEFVPPILYASLSFITVVFILLLPETAGSDLHDTLIEAEKFKGTDKKDIERGSAGTPRTLPPSTNAHAAS